MHRGTTPTIILTLPEDIDLGQARNVYVTISDRDTKITKTDCAIDENVVTVTLTQEESLSLTSAQLQVNWTYMEGTAVKRAASEIVPIHFKKNLEEGVLE